MDWIDKNIAVGSIIDAEFVKGLRDAGIEVVVDARIFFDEPRPFDHEPIVGRVLKMGDLLVRLAEMDVKVLIHCIEGVDRTPFLAMVYVSKRYWKTYKEAYCLVKKQRHQTKYHWDWVKLLEPAHI
jgi:protein-tyrosine phosphatase